MSVINKAAKGALQMCLFISVSSNTYLFTYLCVDMSLKFSIDYSVYLFIVSDAYDKVAKGLHVNCLLVIVHHN